jgi:hypothetical protein
MEGAWDDKNKNKNKRVWPDTGRHLEERRKLA